MKKILYLTMLFMFMAAVPTYAANWTTLKVPLKSANDALVLQARLKVTTVPIRLQTVVVPNDMR